MRGGARRRRRVERAASWSVQTPTWETSGGCFSTSPTALLPPHPFLAMQFLATLTAASATALLLAAQVLAKEKPTSLQVGVKKSVPASECNIKSQNGDRLSM